MISILRKCKIKTDDILEIEINAQFLIQYIFRTSFAIKLLIMLKKNIISFIFIIIYIKIISYVFWFEFFNNEYLSCHIHACTCTCNFIKIPFSEKIHTRHILGLYKTKIILFYHYIAILEMTDLPRYIITNSAASKMR